MAVFGCKNHRIYRNLGPVADIRRRLEYVPYRIPQIHGVDLGASLALLFPQESARVVLHGKKRPQLALLGARALLFPQELLLVFRQEPEKASRKKVIGPGPREAHNIGAPRGTHDDTVSVANNTPGGNFGVACGGVLAQDAGPFL